MNLVSTRDRSHAAPFSRAILDCVPPDGGLYTMQGEEDYRKWLYSMTETTPFSAIAGLLTSILLKKEFSPAVAEAITHKALPFSPELRQLDESLFLLELFHGPSGYFRDFGFSYLVSCFEHFLRMQDRTAVIVAVSSGSFAASMAAAFRKTRRVKALVLFPSGTMKGFTDEDCLWNGGNLYPVEVDADEDRCFALADELLLDPALVDRFGLTVANTTNFGRLLPDMFCYFYAFTRIMKAVHSDIFFALDAGNYSALTAGLYAWRFALPVNGFVTNCTAELTLDPIGKARIPDAIVPLEKRTKADPAHPSSLERLEAVFRTDPALLRALVFPSWVRDEDTAAACRELFMNYGVLLDAETCRAYAAAKKRSLPTGEDKVVLVSYNHPAFSADQIRLWCGEAPEMPEAFAAQHAPVKPKKQIGPRLEELVVCLEDCASCSP
jgi:threonine synthase